MRIAVAADHAGFELKNEIAEYLKELGHEVADLGTDGPAPVDYPDFAEAVGLAVHERRAERGVVVCGSGVGASVAANKIPGVRAGLCHDTYSAHQGVEHDDVNVLVLGSRVIGVELAKELLRAFLAARFTGEERHRRRLAKVKAIEARYCAAVDWPPEAAPLAGSLASSHSLPPALAKAVEVVLADWQAGRKVDRLWSGDAALWSGGDESRWLGWLRLSEDRLTHLAELHALESEVVKAGFRDALLLGMGGSSLCPEVLSETFGSAPDHPRLLVLDSTVPAEVRTREAEVDLPHTLFIVASKSGTTLEPNIFKQYFFARVGEVVKEGRPGAHFVAITDPGSSLEAEAETDGFRRVFAGMPSVGGRFSALSNFGLVPAAILGIDVGRLLERTDRMVAACSEGESVGKNPGLVLGAVLGTAAAAGRDKVTLVTSPGLSALGAWLEQLLAESTGKHGKGLIPVDGERLGPPAVYGDDRLFVYARLQAAADVAQDNAVAALAEAGHPVVTISVADRYAIGEEFFRWEFATAVAGSVLGINPFDQPDVEASKVATRALTEEFEKRGNLPEESPLLTEGDLRLFADPANAEALSAAAGGQPTLVALLRAHLQRLSAGDYFALLAYVERNPRHAAELQALRHAVRDARRVATCLGFGPRFLHSTGQAYKGGPPSGVFLQVTAEDAVDLAVPEHTYTFGVVKAAQARGDLQVLAERGRRALRVHLGADVAAGLAALRAAVAEALG